MIRDVTGAGRLGDLAVLARDAAAARLEHLRLLDAVIAGLFHAGLGLQAAEGLPPDAARQRTVAVLGELDDIIRQIRAATFTEPAQPGPPPRAPATPGSNCGSSHRGGAVQQRGPPAIGMSAKAGKNTFWLPSCQRTPRLPPVPAPHLDGVADALIRLRAFVFASDRRLADVARDVIARRLRLR